MLRAVTTAVAVAALPVGCHGETTEARRAEAGRIAEAVRALREAPGGEKRPFLKALGEISCSVENLCALRKTCVDAYVTELSATDAIATVRHATLAGDPLPKEAGELLARAEAELRRSVDLTKACADREAEARRLYSF